MTEAARNVAHCVNRAHHQNQTFVLLKNGKPFARLIPEGENVRTGKGLAAALAEVEVSTADAIAWRKELAEARKSLKTPAGSSAATW